MLDVTELKPTPPWIVDKLVSIVGVEAALAAAESELEQQVRANYGVLPKRAARLVALVAALRAVPRRIPSGVALD